MHRLILSALVLVLVAHSTNAQSAASPPAQAAAPTKATTDEAAALRAIEGVLNRMTSSAQNADKEAFLNSLDLSNPFFAAEQSAWCDDLVKNGVKDVRFSLAGSSIELDGDTAKVELQIAYTSKKGAATKGTTAHWPARFTKKGAKFLYAGEDWKVLEGDNFTVLYLNGDERIARMALEAFPTSRAHVNEGFGVNPGFQQIKLFQDMDHLKATVYLNQPDPVLMGWNEPKESIKFMRNYSRNVEGWTAAFGHEYGHVATWEYGPGFKTAPWWVTEGAAELAAEDLIPNRREGLDRVITELARTGKLVKWDEIANYDTAEQPVKHMAYRQGHHMVGYISEQWGREGRTRWLKAIGAGKTMDDACLEVMGLTFADLDRAWRATLPAPEPTEEASAAARTSIEDTLSKMAAACKAADAAAYLANIYEGDSEFLYEQRYFANDMKKKPAHEIALSIGELDLRDDVAEGDVTWTWKMAEAKKERSVAFRARFIKSPDNRWLYAGETWNRKVAPGAVVMFDDGLETNAAGALEDFATIREHVETGFKQTDKKLPHKTQKIKLYKSMAHLQQSICLSYENGLGGWNEPNESIKILVRGKGGSLRSVIAHEYGHVATFELGPKSNSMPWWILEGVAELASERWGGKRSGFMDSMAKQGRIAPWTELADFETVTREWQGHVYGQGHHMLGYISDRWGRDKRVDWLSAMSNGSTLDEATQKVLGRSFDQLDKEWRETLPKPEPKPEQKADAEPAAAPEPKSDKQAQPASAN